MTKDEAPKSCECVPPTGHGSDCPVRLLEERQAFEELLRKEKREAHRFSRSEYEQEQRRRIDENTDIYLRLK